LQASADTFETILSIFLLA